MTPLRRAAVNAAAKQMAHTAQPFYGGGDIPKWQNYTKRAAEIIRAYLDRIEEDAPDPNRKRLRPPS